VMLLRDMVVTSSEVKFYIGIHGAVLGCKWLPKVRMLVRRVQMHFREAHC
jgi:hypothetical protein